MLEVIWVILIVSLRPFQNKSDYSLSLGNSLIMFISNGAMLYSSLNDDVIISFGVSIVFVILACIPAIASLFIYFVYDFATEDDDDDGESSEDVDDIEDKSDDPGIKNWSNRAIYNLSNSILALTPIAWTFYGFSVSLLEKDIKL